MTEAVTIAGPPVAHERRCSSETDSASGGEKKCARQFRFSAQWTAICS